MPRETDEELDRIARAVPGWLLRKALHGFGWLIVGLGYLVAVGLFVGACLIVYHFGPAFPPVEWLVREHPFIALVVILVALPGIAWAVGIVALMIGSLISAPGASIADPEGRRGFGILAEKPAVTPQGHVGLHWRRVTDEARERLEAEAATRKAEWDAKMERWRAERKAKEQAEETD